MADRIIYTATTQTNEFNKTPTDIAAFSKEELDTLAGKAWTAVDRSTIQGHVIDPDDMFRVAMNKLSPCERAIVRERFAKHRKA